MVVRRPALLDADGLGLHANRSSAADRGKAADAQLGSAFAELAGRMGVARPVRLLLSKVTDSPSVTGWLRPVVLLPVAAAAGLTPDQLEAVLAHELAHIRRHDYLVNLLQMAAETPALLPSGCVVDLGEDSA
jgi:beta-lactamase regulating signal transducer with metallopeptidase domain